MNIPRPPPPPNLDRCHEIYNIGKRFHGLSKLAFNFYSVKTDVKMRIFKLYKKNNSDEDDALNV